MSPIGLLSGSSASFATPQFLVSTSRGVWIIQSDNSVVSSSENLPSSNTRRNSPPSGPSPCSECGTPVGKYQRSPAPLRQITFRWRTVAFGAKRTSMDFDVRYICCD